MNDTSRLKAASMQAQRVLAKARPDWDRPIDVFAIAADEQIWLASRRLSSDLYGFYLRDGEAKGIVLNANHPEKLQRYTCAHELGHHFLGHASHVDGKDDIYGPVSGGNASEVEAQTFAGTLLMPLQAVIRVLKRWKLTNHELRPSEVYIIARELDVSFSAAAWQLARLGFLDHHKAHDYVSAGALVAKRELRRHEEAYTTNKADLVIIDPRLNGQSVTCRQGDELRLQLPEEPSTGFRWSLDSPHQAVRTRSELQWDGDQAIEAISALESAVENVTLQTLSQSVLDNAIDVTKSKNREFVLLARSEGSIDISASLVRPWTQSTAIENFKTSIVVHPQHELNGFLRPQILEHLRQVGRATL